MAQERTLDVEVIRTVKGKATSWTEGAEKRRLRAAAYCRVSTMNEEQEGSFETQKRAYEGRIAEDPELVLAGIYADRGISGGSTKKRVEFQRMMQDCREGKIDLVMTKSISRFARNLADTLACIRELKGLGIPVHFDREGIDTMDPASDMILGMLAAVAQEEINSLSQNVKWSLERSSAQGNPKIRASYGYRRYMDGGQSVWRICEPEAKRLKAAFDLADQGVVYWKILRELQKMEDADGTGIFWNQQMLFRYFKSVTCMGDLITGTTVTVDCLHGKTILNKGDYPMFYLEDHHEPIISREQFQRVKKRVELGELKSEKHAAIPDRYRSMEWKRKHGIDCKNNNREICDRLRGCCTNRGKGALKNGEKCIYGRYQCYNCHGHGA